MNDLAAWVGHMTEKNIDIDHLAHLARLSLSPEEKQQIASQLVDILKYMQKIAELDLANVEPTAHAVPLINVTRPDCPGSSISHEDALKSAPASVDGLFLVPKIIE